MSEPYYSDDHVTIYHGDCRDIPPLIGPVELVLTDPPYGINYVTQLWCWPGTAPITNDGARLAASLPVSSVPLLDADHVLWFTRWDAWPDVGRPRPVVPDARLPRGTKAVPAWATWHWGPSYELIASAGKGRSSAAAMAAFFAIQQWRQQRDVSTRQRSPSRCPCRSHLVAKLDASTVLDPFMGSGSTSALGISAARPSASNSRSGTARSLRSGAPGGAGPVTVRPLDPPSSRPTAVRTVRPAPRTSSTCWTPCVPHGTQTLRAGGRPTVMFPVAEHGHRLDTTAARALCDRCPVRNPCAEAGRSEKYGVWGGTGSGSRRMRQRERSAAIREVLADGDWHSTGEIAAHVNGHLSTVHRSLVGLVSAGVLERREATPIHLLPTEGDDVNELEALTAAEPKRDRYGRPMVTPRNGGKPKPFTRPTTIADTLDDRHNLELWMQRQVLKGSIARPDLHALAATTDPRRQVGAEQAVRPAARRRSVGRRGQHGYRGPRCDRSGKPWAGCPGDVR